MVYRNLSAGRHLLDISQGYSLPPPPFAETLMLQPADPRLDGVYMLHAAGMCVYVCIVYLDIHILYRQMRRTHAHLFLLKSIPSIFPL